MGYCGTITIVGISRIEINNMFANAIVHSWLCSEKESLWYSPKTPPVVKFDF